MTEQPFLTRDDVAKLGGVDAATVSRYLNRSRPGGRYAADPFPEPDGRPGRRPWWALDREDEIKAWFARLADRSGVGGRPRKDAGRAKG